MMRSIKWILLILGVSPVFIMAQSKQRLNVEGDFYFDSENYIEAESYYQQSADKKNDFQSLYNLGNSQEKQQKAEESVDNYKKALPFAKTDIERSMAHYNMANVLFSQQEQMDIETLETVIDHYKNAIRLYPDHNPAKHNLAAAQIALDMAQKQQEQQQQQQQEQQQNQEEEQEDKKDQNEDQEQQDQQNQEQQPEDQEQKPNQDQESKSEEEKEQERKKIDQKEIENILKMVEKEDSEVQKKMRKQTKSDKKVTKKKW